MLPPKLQPGATIGIVAPSAPITEQLYGQLEKGINALESLGFRVILAPNALSNSLGYSATAQEKADDVNRLFADNSVAAIFCAQGGQNANSVLPLLDYKIIASHPKIFLGISDITVLLLGIFAKTGLVTFHGDDVVWGLGRSADRYELTALQRVLVQGTAGAVQQNSPWRTICGRGKVRGRLLGGNITCLGKIIGTEYLPDFSDAILFLEDYGEENTADKTSYALHHLDQAGIFKQVNGLVLGYYKTAGNITLDSVARDIMTKYDFPIVGTSDFGHTTPNTILPVGARVQLDADEAELVVTDQYIR